MLPCQKTCPSYREGCHKTCANWLLFQRRQKEQREANTWPGAPRRSTSWRAFRCVAKYGEKRIRGSRGADSPGGLSVFVRKDWK